MRNLSESLRTQKVLFEESTNWPWVLSLSNLMHQAILMLFYSTFFLIMVTGILNLQLMMFACCIFLVFNFFADLIVQFINDKSQMAKNLLFLSQFLSFLAGVFVVLAGKGYFAE